MRAFARLFEEIDATTSTNGKVAAIVRYLRAAPAADAAWAVYFLTGQKLRRVVEGPALRRWAMEVSGVEEWLFGECYSAVGDSGETISLLVAAGRGAMNAGTGAAEVSLAEWVEERLLPLRELPEDEQRAKVVAWWSELSQLEVFILCKLMTGAFRVGVSRTLVVRAVAEISGRPSAEVEHGLMGTWRPTAGMYERLLAGEAAPGEEAAERSAPYPYFLASAFEGDPAELGEISQWQAEWKWDGIRGQLIRRGGHVYLWSRGEELITERFPEIAAAAARLPDGAVLDGEVLAWDAEGGKPMGFQALQKRIGRKTVSPKLLREVPAVFVAYDVLEAENVDLRPRPLTERRAKLEAILASLGPGAGERLRASEPLAADATWADLAALRAGSRARNVEGLMLKRRDSAYGVGRRVGDWWKWKIEPHSVDAVLLYGQPGSGKRANLLTDYTFAVWDEDGDARKLVPFAKAYSGLTNEEIAELDRWIRAHTTERFGPVRAVEPIQVFELGFEAINVSNRHQSGVAVRFPRILRWRKDKTAEQADTLETVRGLAKV